jgi:hypothetical protein
MRALGITASTFSPRAEFLVHLVRNDQCLGSADQDVVARPKSVQRCSSPKSIAEALLVLPKFLGVNYKQ